MVPADFLRSVGFKRRDILATFLLQGAGGALSAALFVRTGRLLQGRSRPFGLAEPVFALAFALAGIVAALVFTLAHVGFRLAPFELFHLVPLQLVQALVLGVFYSWAYHRTGSLLAPIVAHNFSDGVLWLGEYFLLWVQGTTGALPLLGMFFFFLWRFFWMVYTAIFIALIATLYAFSAWAMISAAFCLPSSTSSARRCSACTRASWPFSAAARPSAIRVSRSCICFNRYGQMYFQVNVTKIRNAIDCPIRVALKFTS